MNRDVFRIPARCVAAAVLAALVSAAGCGPHRTPEQERARQELIGYCQMLPGHSPQQCECMADNLEDRLGEPEFQELARAVAGLNDVRDPSSLFNVMGDVFHALSGAGTELDQAFREAERECGE